MGNGTRGYRVGMASESRSLYKGGTSRTYPPIVSYGTRQTADNTRSELEEGIKNT